MRPSGTAWKEILIAKGTSVFTGKIGEQVASEKCTIVDNGTLANRRGSLTVDDEGTQTQKYHLD
ncbi:TldD protein, part of TldE/TldD proteolytic complex [uncultured Gammaproteobacteria bacterium]|nr:TldD protein, part of TldE/TldD proteolytic complex [uncultured Gammaproteobacteria bacterium]